ncbi:MAG: bifunctional shikimate kinase/3-dehydroquinate synthase [Myxococcota bacterium]
MTSLWRSVVLVGPPGVGKSSIARLAGHELAVPTIDLDECIAARTGRSPATLLDDGGEVALRVAELDALREVLRGPPALIAAGSGLVPPAAARDELARCARVVWLDATVPALQARLASKGAPRRPLLEDADGNFDLERLRPLLEARRLHWAALASTTVDTSGATLQEAASRLAAVLRAPERPVRPSTTPSFIRWGIAAWEPPREATGVLVVDEGCIDNSAFAALRARYASWPMLSLPGGEGVKSLTMVASLASDLVAAGLSPDGQVVAVGGGAVLDLVGFVAATLFRGMRWTAVPTTLLAQVDASVGGKTAVNLAAGKNLLGAFHLPDEVFIEPRFLETLPSRQRVAGTVEMLKHAFLAADAPLDGTAATVDEGLPSLAAGHASVDVMEHLLRRSVAIKAAVVRCDPQERGLRAVLNLGHTFGHAVETEAALTSTPMLHGEAVAVGLRFALELSRLAAGLDDEVAMRLSERLGALRVPPPAVGLDVQAIVSRMGYDKKRRQGRARFIALAEPGAPIVLDDVADDLVRACATAALQVR